MILRGQEEGSGLFRETAARQPGRGSESRVGHLDLPREAAEAPGSPPLGDRMGQSPGAVWSPHLFQHLAALAHEDQHKSCFLHFQNKSAVGTKRGVFVWDLGSPGIY